MLRPDICEQKTMIPCAIFTRIDDCVRGLLRNTVYVVLGTGCLAEAKRFYPHKVATFYRAFTNNRNMFQKWLMISDQQSSLGKVS
jgi:hypothetical protein